ncbi:MAG: chitobiase/beta-hexosaminidase C-terminal domain-containing protein [Labilithrix sp.]|nr:chitobiase/beta-hexosaminidase C-terminal domain-containing protein [Labilithrix sp.]
MTITSATPDATIFYTTDGTQPNSGSRVASGTITISAEGTTQIRAYAAAANFLDSAVTFIDITIQLVPGETAPPVFNPTSTTQSNTFPVALSSSTADATICVTTDGTTTPTCNNGVCSGSSSTYNAVSQVQITRTGTRVSAVACKVGGTTSPVVSQDYVLQSANPTASPAPGIFTGEQVISLDSATTGSRLVFTTSLTGTAPADPICAGANPGTVDGQTVTTVNGGQSLSFNIRKNIIIKAISCKDQFVTSDVQTFTYSRRLPTPVLTQAKGAEFNTETTLSMGAPAPTGTEVDCWTIDGTDPACAPAGGCSAGTNFTTAPQITRDNQTVKVIRCDGANALPSAIDSFNYRLKVGAVAASWTVTGCTGGAGAGCTATNNTTTTSVDTNTGTNVNVTSLTVTTTTGEIVCYRLDDVAPTCVHTPVVPTPALPADAETVACGTGSTNAGTDPVGNKSLPIKVRAIGCKADFQDSAERSIFFGAADSAISVTTTPSAGTLNNDTLIEFQPSQAIGTGAICYTRAIEGAPTHADPACNPARTACAAGSLTYNTGDKPAVNSTSSGPVGSAAVQGNRFKVIACKPGTTGAVSDVGTYLTRVGAVTASSASGAIPTGTVVTFSTPTLPGAGGTNGNPDPSTDPVNFCIAAGPTVAPSVGCLIGGDGRQTGGCATGTLVAGTTVGTNSTATRTINASEQINVVACKAGYADSGVATFTYTTSGVAAPTFDLGTGNVSLYRRAGATLTVTRPSGTQICFTTDGTDPSCKLDGTTDCNVGTSTAPVVATTSTIPVAFSTTVDPAPSVTVKAVTCQASPALQSAGAPTTAVFSLAASPLVISAFSDTLAAPTFNGSGVIVPNVANPARNPGAQPSTPTEPAVDIYISQAPQTDRPPTLGGTICYTLDGSAPTVRFGTPGTAGVDTNTATPLNNSAAAVDANAGCVAANAATTCIRGTAGNPTVVNSTVDPRLQGVTRSVQVRALQCKNTGYGNSAIAGNASPVNDYTFTPYSAAATFNFDGANNGGTGSVGAFAAVDQITESGPGSMFATWNATHIFLGFTGLTTASGNNTPTNFIQFYMRGGNASPTNTTTVADSDTQGSLVGWPAGTGAGAGAQTLPLPVNYHLYFDRANIGLGPAIVVTPVLRFFNGTAWTTLNPTDTSAAVEVRSIEDGIVEVQISRAAIQNPSRFVAFGSSTATAGTTLSNSYPTGSTAAPATDTGNPVVPQTAGWLRFNLSGFKAPQWRDTTALPGPGITLDTNMKLGGDAFPKANAGTDGTSGDTTLGNTQVTTP